MEVWIYFQFVQSKLIWKHPHSHRYYSWWRHFSSAWVPGSSSYYHTSCTISLFKYTDSNFLVKKKKFRICYIICLAEDLSSVWLFLMDVRWRMRMKIYVIFFKHKKFYSNIFTKYGLKVFLAAPSHFILYLFIFLNTLSNRFAILFSVSYRYYFFIFFKKKFSTFFYSSNLIEKCYILNILQYLDNKLYVVSYY